MIQMIHLGRLSSFTLSKLVFPCCLFYRFSPKSSSGFSLP